MSLKDNLNVEKTKVITFRSVNVSFFLGYHNVNYQVVGKI